MTTFNPSDDALRKLVAGSRAVPDISSDDIEAALADATTKNTLSDEQVARVLGKVHRLITAASENIAPGERPVSNGVSAASADGHSSTEREPKLVIIPASSATQRRVSRTAIAAFMASLSLLLGVCLLTPRELPRRVSERDHRQQTLADDLHNQAGQYRLTAKPAPDVVEPAKVAIGDTIETREFERRRLALPDDSVLYVNSNSSVLVRSTRSIDVTRGSIFVEVDQKPDAAKFEVITPNRTVTSLGTKFAVSVADSETAVTVTQGRVLVSGIKEPVSAGQKLVTTTPSGERPVSAGRYDSSSANTNASDTENLNRTGGLTPTARQNDEAYILTSLPSAASELEWTRDLIAAATGPLVPKSEYAGGALVTIDPNGQSSQLSLRKYHVDVHIEDGFARTTIDQTYFNHTHSRLEGTFHFPLPPDASLSRLAMYVNGKLMEGGMAERDHARNTFEEIKRKMLDPALLEWVDGSTFKMRVFPLEPRQAKRIILSYSQRLPSVDGQMTYRFPAGHTMDVVREWSTAVRIKNGDGSTWHSPSHDLKPVDSTAGNDAADLLLEASEKNAMLDRDLVIRVTSRNHQSASTVPSPPRSGEKVADRPDEGVDARNSNSANEADRTKSPLTLALSPDGERGQGGLSKFEISNLKFESHQYLMLRLCPDLAGEMQRKPHHWVFLFEHSGDRSPLLARTQIEILRTLLNNAEHTDTFSIVKASTRATPYAEQPLPCTPENIAAAVKHLENVHLVGAMDLAVALQSAPVPSPPRSGEKVADRPDEGADARNSNSADEADRTKGPLTLSLSPESGERGQERQTNPGPPLSAFRFPVLVHLGSGHTALGERDAAKLAELLPKDVPYIGIGVGKRWNQSLMNLAASRTGGLSVQINPDEDVAWRAFEVFSKLHSPRLLNVKVESGKPKAESGAASTVPSPPRSGESVSSASARPRPTRADTPDEGADAQPANSTDEADRTNGPLTLALSPDSGKRGQGIDEPKAESGQAQELKSEISNLKSEIPAPHFLLFSDTISQGEEIAAICRVAEGQSLPKEITVTATLNGQPWSQTVAVENIKEQASYLPRHWAKLEIDRLLAENAAANRESIVALSKSMYVMSPFTSLLVLENDEMYTQFNVDRGRKDHWAMYACPDQVPVVVENSHSTHPTDAKNDGESPTSDSILRDVSSTIVRIPPLSWPSGFTSRTRFEGRRLSRLNESIPSIDRFGRDNLWFGQNPADDFITPPRLNYFMYQGGWNFSPVQNDWGSNGLFESAYKNGLVPEYRQVVPVIPGVPTLAPTTDSNASPRYDFLYRTPQFTSPTETSSFLFSPAPILLGKPFGYVDLDPSYEYTIPLGAPIFMGRYNFGLGQEEWSPFVAHAPINRWDLGHADFEEPLENIFDPQLDFEGRLSTATSSAEHRNATQQAIAIEREKVRQSIADIKGRNRDSFFGNQLNEFEQASIFFVQGMENHYLDTQGWAELLVRQQRLQVWEQMLPPLERQTVASLTTKVSLHVHDAEFQSAIQQLATSSGVKIVIDVPALRRVGISEKQLVNVDVDGITLKSVLNLLMDQVGDLMYLVKGDVITIRPTRRREQNGSSGLPLFANAHRWDAAQPGDGASLVSLPVFGGFASQPFMGSPGIFVDLMSHAPGLNTSTADALAVMEAEASISNLKFEISNPPAGRVDEAARGLIEKARGRGWESITIGGSNNEPGITIFYDGQGRHVWERVISEGLREQVVCDGTTLWHVYRDLGLASKRPFSRFHHEDFSRLVPWLLPSADELARGADVVALDERTVAVVPLESGKPKAESGDGNVESEILDLKSQMSQLRLHLLFDADGRLVERQWIERSQTNGVETNTTLLRITYAADGVVKVIDRDGKEQMTLDLHRAIAAEPKLIPDLNGLVVLPMPVRSPEVILERLQADKATMQNADLGQVGLRDADLSEDEALSLMLAYMANGNAARMIEIARARFIEKGDTRDGLYVLLSRYPSALVRGAEPAPPNGTASAGFDLRPSVEGSPLRQYLRQCINWMDEPNPFVSTQDFRIDAPEGSFLKRMATARNWHVRWSSGNATKDLTQAQVQADVEQTLAFVATCQNDRIAWMILSAIKPQLSTTEQQAMFAKSMERFESHLQIGRFARQERITALFAAGQHEEARRLFAEWFRDQFDSGTMPVIGEELYRAYVAGPKGNEPFTELIASEAKRLLETQRLMTVNLLAIQISQLGDLPLADRLMTMLIEKLKVDERPDVSLLAIEHLRRFNDPRAATLLDRMLELPSVSDLPQIWRFAATMAESSGHKRLAVDRLELAIQLEFATRPTTINIETVRADYTALLAKYEELINAAATLETAPPEGLAERIIQAADQWRSLDDDDTPACQTAARLLAKLKQNELAWDYQITPLAENSGESAPWINLARQLTADKSFVLADMAWSRAFEFESSNPEILLEHAKMQVESKSKDAAKALLQRIESGSWQPRFQQSVQEAGRLLMSL